MKLTWTLCAVVLMSALFLANGDTLATGESPKGEIIGSKKCNTCHKKKKSGNQAKIWQDSAHAGAYAVLATDAAKATAKERGLGDPQQEPECLACHTTQGFHSDAKIAAKSKYTPDEGVGCEVCHNPGSKYKKNKIMKDPEAAKAAGLLMPGEDFCLNCHNERSPNFQEFNYEERWKQIAHPVPTTK